MKISAPKVRRCLVSTGLHHINLDTWISNAIVLPPFLLPEARATRFLRAISRYDLEEIHSNYIGTVEKSNN